MNEFYILLKNLLTVAEVTAAVVGIIKFKKFSNSYWKWFIFYLIFIACSELVFKFIKIDRRFEANYFAFFVIPLEFLTVFWLYGYKSLNNKKLFWISTLILLISLVPYISVKAIQMVNSFNYLLGGFLTSIMIILEYNKQIKSDDILNFKENMMFYINIGVGLFYVGTLPFFAFNSLLWKEKEIFFNYYAIFLITNIIMYTLFSIAFIWGKPNTY